MNCKFFATAAVALTVAQAGQAATVTYTTLASYNAAVGGSSVAENFTGNKFNGSIIAQVLGAYSLASNRMQSVAGTNSGPQFTTLVFTTGIKSFAANIGSLGAAELANVLLDGVKVATIAGGSTFFGLTASKTFHTLTFADATYPARNTQFNIDNLRISAVPIAAGLPLLLGGLGALAGVARRKRRLA